MATEVKKEKVAKTAAPKLAAFVDRPFPIYITVDGKDRDAMVLSSGAIKYKEKEYSSPCAAATAVAKELDIDWTANAWTAWKFNKDGERVALDTIRGAKSPLAKVVKTPKPKKAKAEKKARKPRAAKKRVEAVAADWPCVSRS